MSGLSRWIVLNQICFFPLQTTPFLDNFHVQLAQKVPAIILVYCFTSINKYCWKGRIRMHFCSIVKDYRTNFTHSFLKPTISLGISYVVKDNTTLKSLISGLCLPQLVRRKIWRPFQQVHVASEWQGTSTSKSQCREENILPCYTKESLTVFRNRRLCLYSELQTSATLLFAVT